MDKKRPTIFELISLPVSAAASLVACSNLDLDEADSLLLGWFIGTITYVLLSMQER